MNRSQELHYPLVVVGGGLSGLCAAIAAARHGVKTALVQARPVLGGNSSSEIRVHIVGASCHFGKKNLRETGLLEEFLLENKHRNPYHSFSIWDSVLWEKARFQENLDCYLNTSMTQAFVSNGSIQKVRCYQQTTEITYDFSGDIFVDATGNGTLAYFAGAPFKVGEESRNEYGEPHAQDAPSSYTMGNTIMFIAENKGESVSFEKPYWAYRFTEEDLRYFGHGNMSRYHGENGITEEFNADSGYWWIEFGGKTGDIIGNAERITDELYKCVFGVWDHIKNVGDHGAANYALSWFAAIPGTRESRRIMGEYVLTENDILQNTPFEDAVAYGGWPMDEHYPDGIYTRNSHPSRLINFQGAYTIPYRCYLPRGVDNLLLAGRDISVTHRAFTSTRVMGTCAVGGQAVGTAAALALEYGIAPRDVLKHIKELQQELLRDGCYIPGLRNEDPDDLARTGRVSASSYQPGWEPDQVINGISRPEDKRNNGWKSQKLSAKGEWLRLALPDVRTLYEIRLTFDSNLSHEIMPSITRTVQAREDKGLPSELVRHYRLRVMLAQEIVFAQDYYDNCQRLRIHPLPENVSGDQVEITVMETWGAADACIFEVRIY